MVFVAPPNACGILVPPSAANPPTLQDIINAQKYAQELRYAALSEAPDRATNEEVAMAMEYPTNVTLAIPIQDLPPMIATLDAALQSGTQAATESSLQPAITSAIQSAIPPAIESAITPVIESAITPAIESAVSPAIESAPSAAIGSAIPLAIESAIPPAIESALQLAIQSTFQVIQRLISMERNLKIRTNMTAYEGHGIPYTIVPFLDGTDPVQDHNLPILDSIDAIKSLDDLGVQAYCIGYGLPFRGTALACQRSIARSIGCRAVF